jgi:hypothetical protein
MFAETSISISLGSVLPRADSMHWAPVTKASALKLLVIVSWCLLMDISKRQFYEYVHLWEEFYLEIKSPISYGKLDGYNKPTSLSTDNGVFSRSDVMVVHNNIGSWFQGCKCLWTREDESTNFQLFLFFLQFFPTRLPVKILILEYALCIIIFSFITCVGHFRGRLSWFATSQFERPTAILWL